MKILNKIFIMVVLSTAISASVMAEDTTSKQNVLIDNFLYRDDIGAATALQLRNYVMQGIQETNRVDLIDVNSNAALAVEESRRNSGVDAAGDPERLKVMVQEGANALITGEVTGLVINERKLDSGSKYYEAVINYSLKVIDPNTGKIVFNKSFKHGGDLLDMQSGDSPEEAIMLVSKKAVKEMRPFVEEAFPIYGSILEVNEVKKDEVKSAYISVGSDTGVSKGNRFDICLERQVAGRTSQSVIGELEVVAVEGGDISLAKIKKGGKELKTALDANQTIVLKSKPKGIKVWEKAAI